MSFPGPWYLKTLRHPGVTCLLDINQLRLSRILGPRPLHLFHPTVKEYFEGKITSVPVTMHGSRILTYREMVRLLELTSLFGGPRRYDHLGEISRNGQTQRPHSMT